MDKVVISNSELRLHPYRISIYHRIISKDTKIYATIVMMSHLYGRHVTMPMSVEMQC
jgi:hypothetical protein